MCNCNKKNSYEYVQNLALNYSLVNKCQVVIYKKNNGFDFVEYDYAIQKNINYIKIIGE